MDKSLEKRLEELEARNQRVEIEKSWEVSWTRRILLSILTYLIIVLFMWFFELPDPFMNAIIPALALLLSGPSLTIAKRLWIKQRA